MVSSVTNRLQLINFWPRSIYRLGLLNTTWLTFQPGARWLLRFKTASDSRQKDRWPGSQCCRSSGNPPRQSTVWLHSFQALRAWACLWFYTKDLDLKFRDNPAFWLSKERNRLTKSLTLWFLFGFHSAELARYQCLNCRSRVWQTLCYAGLIVETSLPRLHWALIFGQA